MEKYLDKSLKWRSYANKMSKKYFLYIVGKSAQISNPIKKMHFLCKKIKIIK